jgi:hypothetical protein
MLFVFVLYILYAMHGVYIHYSINTSGKWILMKFFVEKLPLKYKFDTFLFTLLHTFKEIS